MEMLVNHPDFDLKQFGEDLARERAKQAGYRVVLMFIGTTSVEINLARVKARVLRGGHDVPEVDQRRRYSRRLANVGRLLPIADSALLFDNSSDEGPRLVAFG